jgi:molybdate transport system regulatory protein
MKMSYKKAWDLINHLNACTTTPLVIPHAGGEKGGGSILTSEARALIAYYRSIQREFTAFLEKENRKLGF